VPKPKLSKSEVQEGKDLEKLVSDGDKSETGLLLEILAEVKRTRDYAERAFQIAEANARHEAKRR
jgi:hypothetical protein